MNRRHLPWYSILMLACVALLAITTPLQTAVAQGGGVKPPIPYPDATPLDVGGTPANKLPIDQIVVYKALPEYHQAPWLDKFVADGTLPAVKDRLPKEPAVYLKSG